jgi:type I restriction enzyme M protein
MLNGVMGLVEAANSKLALYTVTLPCTFWFFDRGKVSTERQNKVLFLDARHLYRQIDRAHRDWSDA